MDNAMKKAAKKADAAAQAQVLAYAERYHAKGLCAEHPRLVVAMMRDLAGWPVLDASAAHGYIAHFTTADAANLAVLTARRNARALGIAA